MKLHSTESSKGAVNSCVQVLSRKNQSPTNNTFLLFRLSAAIVQRFDLRAFTSICRLSRDKVRNIRVLLDGTTWQRRSYRFIAFPSLWGGVEQSPLLLMPLLIACSRTSYQRDSVSMLH
jgi:hypothetical protein